MIKVRVFVPEVKNNFEYFSSIVPNLMDRIDVGKGVFMTVKERCLFPDNPNYVIIHVAP